MPDEAITIGVDRVRIEQAVANLLNNAIKFTPEGGSVSVSLSQDESEAGINVADTGIGIEPGFLPRVFERFSQAHGGINRRYGGLGLGLAIAHAMVLAHAGRVTAESKGVGHGSRFTVHLPVERAGAKFSVGKEAKPVIESANEAIKFEPLNLTVLVIEDSTDTLNLFRLWESQSSGSPILSSPT
jgi:K+-sensing histidine kinase KdpD